MFIFFIFLFLNTKNIVLSLIPIWNLSPSSVKLLPGKNSEEYNFITLYDYFYQGVQNKIHLNLTQVISKKDQNINTQNIVKINSENYQYTNWKIVEGYFFESVGHFVCPKSKGQYFLNQYSSSKYSIIQPSSFDNSDENNEWEINCFQTVKVGDNEWMIEGFLNMKTEINYNLWAKKISELNGNKNDNKANWLTIKIDDKLFDFLWPNQIYSSKKFNMFALTLKDKEIWLNDIIIKIDGSLSQESKNHLVLGYKSDYSFAYFNYSSKTFYWALANSTDEFECGYSIESLDIESNNVNVDKISYNTSPFRILDKNAVIKKMEMIRNTRFVYYEINYNNEESGLYRGIIDIELNSIIFHTNETFIDFIPLNFSLVAITKDTAYQICAIKYDDKCVERCPNNLDIYLDTIEGNYCGRSNTCIDHGYLLLPKDICISECRKDYYYINTKKKECGLCMDIDPNKPFKIINKNECIEEKPNNTYYISEKYKILNYCPDNCKECENLEKCLVCEKGYKLNDNYICEPENCYKNCESCFGFSSNEKDQKCITCKKGFYLDGNNCEKKCKDGFYKDDVNRNCSICHENCQKCSNGPIGSNENCDSCKSNFYLINIENYDRNCTADCPNGTFKHTKINECLDIEEEEEKTLLLWIFIIIIGFFLMITIICIFRKISISNKITSDLINTDLKPRRNLIVE